MAIVPLEEPYPEKKRAESTFAKIKPGTWFVFLEQSEHGPARICVRQESSNLYYSFTDGKMVQMRSGMFDQAVIRLQKPTYSF